MLRIKDDVDLKELEKFGFVKLNIMDDEECIKTNIYCAIQESDKGYIENECINNYNVEFYFNYQREMEYCTYPECRNEDFILDKIFDLITAGLVEKVEE